LFKGIYQILHTPFHDDGAIDWDSFSRQVEYCIAAGVHGVVVPAMASEFFSLTDAERFEVTEFALKAVAGRVPVLVGAQGITTQAAVMFGEHGAKHGADGLMAMPPYLRKASKGETEQYFRALAGLGLPVMIQNAPALAGISLTPADLAAMLRSDANIAYVKEEAPPILQRITQVLNAAGDACLGVFGGANGLYLVDELQRGACGNMPAGGMVDIQVKVYELYVAGEVEAAEALNLRLLPLLNYAAIYGVTFHKYILHRRGVLDSSFARDPQRTNLDEHDKRAIDNAWKLIEDETLETFAIQR
jgi:4-hydroxy-tetrahydrodipicolinate synthase